CAVSGSTDETTDYDYTFDLENGWTRIDPPPTPDVPALAPPRPITGGSSSTDDIQDQPPTEPAYPTLKPTPVPTLPPYDPCRDQSAELKAVDTAAHESFTNTIVNRQALVEFERSQDAVTAYHEAKGDGPAAAASKAKQGRANREWDQQNQIAEDIKDLWANLKRRFQQEAQKEIPCRKKTNTTIEGIDDIVITGKPIRISLAPVPAPPSAPTDDFIRGVLEITKFDPGSCPGPGQSALVGVGDNSEPTNTGSESPFGEGGKGETEADAPNSDSGATQSEDKERDGQSDSSSGFYPGKGFSVPGDDLEPGGTAGPDVLDRPGVNERYVVNLDNAMGVQDFIVMTLFGTDRFPEPAFYEASPADWTQPAPFVDESILDLETIEDRHRHWVLVWGPKNAQPPAPNQDLADWMAETAPSGLPGFMFTGIGVSETTPAIGSGQGIGLTTASEVFEAGPWSLYDADETATCGEPQAGDAQP
ncbi:MAG: hypothetical protein AAFQ67_04665, partial [Pseudomonadota bacterium]